jgi:hypothetical protein
MKPQITVKELIELLWTVDPNCKVLLEGCDCHGEAVGIATYEESIIITRND